MNLIHFPEVYSHPSASEGIYSVVMSILDGTIREPLKDHDLRFEWESINIHARRVPLSTIPKEINKDFI